MAKSPKRHYMPASSIGFFSASAEGRRRSRAVSCMRKEAPKCFEASAESVGWLRDVYGTGKPVGFDHDSFFKPFEALNNDELTPLLEDQHIRKDADLWVKLAAYVCSRFTRDPQLELQSSELFAQWKAPAAVGYPFNMQRKGAAVLRSRWEFIHSPHSEFILSDRGYAAFFHPLWDHPALIVPLRRHSAVVLGNGARFQKQMAWDGQAWHIEIPSRRVNSLVTNTLNAHLWSGSLREAYASKPAFLEDAARLAESYPEDMREFTTAHGLQGAILGSTLDENRADELLLYKLLSGVSAPMPGGTEHLIV